MHRPFGLWSLPPLERFGTDSRGYRLAEDVPEAKPPGTIRIAALGGSALFGFSVASEDSIPSQIEARLRSRGALNVEVLNFGMPGYLSTIEQWKGMELRTASDEQLLSGVRALTVADAMYWFDVAIVVGMAKVTDGLLHSFLASRARRVFGAPVERHRPAGRNSDSCPCPRALQRRQLGVRGAEDQE